MPAHKTNKIAVRGGVVSGIDKLSYVEWKEASEMLGAMGVPVPDYDSGKRPKNKRWIVEYSDEIEAREGWEAAHKPERRIDPLAKEKLIEGILAGEEDFESVSFDTNLRQTRPVANKSGDNAASYGLLEFEPTPLVDAREVVPPTASRASDVESAPTGHASSPASWAANPGMADLLGDIVAEQAGLSNSSGGLELAASTKVSLAGLGEGWMEEFEADISPADRRAAARDRQRTFAQMGIPVPDLVRRLALMMVSINRELTVRHSTCAGSPAHAQGRLGPARECVAELSTLPQDQAKDADLIMCLLHPQSGTVLPTGQSRRSDTPSGTVVTGARARSRLSDAHANRRSSPVADAIAYGWRRMSLSQGEGTVRTGETTWKDCRGPQAGDKLRSSGGPGETPRRARACVRPAGENGVVQGREEGESRPGAQCKFGRGSAQGWRWESTDAGRRECMF